MIRRFRAWAFFGPTLALGAILSLPGCGGDEKARPEPAADPTPSQSAPQLGERLESFRAEPTVVGLLALLGTPHQLVREAGLGPHTIRYQAHFELRPQKADDAPPKVGEQVTSNFDVDDELELRWAPAVDGNERAWLRQTNNHEDRRELVLLDGKAYTRLHEDTWYARELDGDLHERWFAEAYAAVHDMVQFAAPQLEITQVSEGKTAAGEPAVVVHFGLAPARDESLGRDGATSRWRASSRIDAIEGQLALHPSTGAWLEADMSLAWRMSDGAQRPLSGKSSMKATLTPGEVEITAPEGAQPMPERHRYELERNKLLDGLAAP